MLHEMAADLARQDVSDDEAVRFLAGAISGWLPESEMERADEIARDAFAKAKKSARRTAGRDPGSTFSKRFGMTEHGKAEKTAGRDPGSTFDEMLGMTEHGKAMNAKAAAPPKKATARARKGAPDAKDQTAAEPGIVTMPNRGGA